MFKVQRHIWKNRQNYQTHSPFSKGTNGKFIMHQRVTAHGGLNVVGGRSLNDAIWQQGQSLLVRASNLNGK